jgi:hypothetical protein
VRRGNAPQHSLVSAFRGGGIQACLQASSRGLGLRVGGEGADAEAGGAAGLLIPHRSGDVEVRPRRVADEFLEEERGGDRAWVVSA